LSQVRHRLLWAILTESEEGSIKKIIKSKNVLHFAPEKVITNLLKPFCATYKTEDLLAKGYLHSYSHIDYNMDISNMYQLMNEEFDCIIACDVLEHVVDDNKALKEIFRVLTKGGYCIFTVPQKDNLEVIYEDNLITDPEKRTECFGQFDHLRIYGNDFLDRMSARGFHSYQIDENIFTEKQRKKNVLRPPILLKHPLATNYRKFFIGYKS
jgi:SAM-dependent methyltransferase